MTSQLLRKLQTILWSTPRRTDSASAVKNLLRGVSLAGMVAFMTAPEAAADNARAPMRTAAPVVQRPEIAGAMTAEEGVSRSAASSTVIRRTTRTRVTQAGGTPPEALFAEKRAVVPVAAVMPEPPATQNAPAISEEARQQIAPPADRSYSRTQNVDEGFSARMDYVLSGGVMSSSAESVGEWWEERSERMVSRIQPGRQQPQQPPMQRLANAHRQVMNNITLPDQPVPEVDFYDAAPIAVTSSTQGVTQTAAQQEGTFGGDASPTSRLKTDIRTIQPTLSYAMKGIVPDQLPEDFNERGHAGDYQPRQASPTVYQWAPTNFYHYPLYFEDPSLERYGHTHHPIIQPFASTGLFATQLVGLPYQMALHPVHSKQYALGYYRPGEYAPKKYYQIPFNEEATVVEVATIVGLFLIIP